MSIRILSETIDDLPHALSKQVMSYARSLEYAAPEIFKEAGIRQSRELTNILVFVAGLRKLYSIVASNYWVLDNAGAILSSQQQQNVRVGGMDLSRGGNYHQSLNKLRSELADLLSKHQLLQYVREMPYVELLRGLADGHQLSSK